MKYRFFIYHFGAVYVMCKKINRNGQVFYRDKMGNEMPAHKTAKQLTGEEKDRFVDAYNRAASDRLEAHKKIHPEDKGFSTSNMTYEEILDEIRNTGV